MGREQWAGSKDAPKMGSALFDMKVDALHGGAGMNFTYEKDGPIQVYDFNANYSYHVNLQNGRILGLGLSGGFGKCKINNLMVDPILTTNDNQDFYQFKFGLFYASNHLEVGISSGHIKAAKITNVETKLNSQYLLFGAYRFDIGENFDIKPNILIKMYELGGVDFRLSSGLLFIFKEKFWAGATYIMDDKLGALFGFDIINKIRIGYSFDMLTAPMNKSARNYGNHEIIAAVKIK
jgi:type IX secretion system PorP/SprF family membrane protein